jgi:hypothetical protein
MRIEVGRVYEAIMPSEDPSGDMFWRVQIIAEVEQDGARYFVGLTLGQGFSNYCARMYDTNGKQHDMEAGGLGLMLTRLSRVKPQWTVRSSTAAAAT